MSAEGKPQTEFSLLERPLKLLTLLVARFPVSVITVSALLVALSLTSAQLSLGFRTSRADLLNPKSEYNRRWNEFAEEFGEQDDVTVVVHGKTRSPCRRSWMSWPTNSIASRGSSASSTTRSISPR